MLTARPLILAALLFAVVTTTAPAAPATIAPFTVADLAQQAAALPAHGVRAVEVSDYAFGGYRGDFPAPPHADLNPHRAVVILWKDFPSFRFVFAHEGSYCPWFEFPADGAGCCFQFYEGNDGWAALFNQFGRQERNSFVDVIDAGPGRVWVRWTYFGVNQDTGQPAYRGTEDFYALPNGLVLRRQSYRTLMPGDHRGYAREPIELIGLCPVGKLWRDVLRPGRNDNERHALAILDAFSPRRSDAYWTPKPNTLWDATTRHAGDDFKVLDDAPGVALVLPLKAGLVFTAFGDASGFGHTFTHLKDHSFPGVGNNWRSSSWDHWPIGWLNSQAHPVDAESLKRYPNHFSPAGMDFFALPDAQTENRDVWSLCGVGRDEEAVRAAARAWLSSGAALKDPAATAAIPSPFLPSAATRP